jgi:NAD-dependent deacetylase sirtuin 1
LLLLLLLERKVGIDRVIECHGSFSSFKCLDCKKTRKLDNDIENCIRNKKVLYCNNNKCKGEGILKPEITFFGEKVPKIFDKTFKLDLNSNCDCIIVIGTSLKVGGSVHEILKKMDPTIPRILINKNIVEISNMPNNKSSGFDLSLLGNCDDIISYLCSLLGWTIDDNNNTTNNNYYYNNNNNNNNSSSSSSSSSSSNDNMNKRWNCQSKVSGIYEISTL